MNGATIYPNPASDVLTISTILNIDKIIISNTMGQEIIVLDRPSNEINISSMEKGIYFITLHSQKGVLTQKFIKK